jgi:hypothetical protein
MTPELKEIIEEAYRVFGRYGVRRSLTVCHCDCCMTPETEQELLVTPLREIPHELLAEYTNSAHEWDDGPVAREMRYFLPRYFELIALNECPFDMDIDICLRRLAHAEWRAKWPAEEVEIIDRYFDALVASSTHKLKLVEWPAGWRLQFDMADVLTLIVTAQGNLETALSAWDGASDPEAAIHMAAQRERVLIEGRRTYLHSAYLEGEFDQAADAIGAFLMRPEVDRRLEAAFFAVTDPRLQKIISDAMVP